MMKIFPEFIDQLELIQSIRRDIHAHPELKFTEFRTSELIAQKLQSWGIQTHIGLGKTGPHNSEPTIFFKRFFNSFDHLRSF